MADAEIMIIRDDHAVIRMGEGSLKVAREVLPWLGEPEWEAWDRAYELVAAHLERHGTRGVRGDYLEADCANGEKVWVIRTTDGPDLLICAARLPEGFEGPIHAA
jgi:hypothetical protein